MAEITVKLPDVGEGIAEAELVEWHVKVGDVVREDDILAAVMTDKATVEIPVPSGGEVLWIGANVGETVAVGSPLVRLGGVSNRIVTDIRENPTSPQEQKSPSVSAPHLASHSAQSAAEAQPTCDSSIPVRTTPAVRPLAAPSVRQRVRDLGMDLRLVPGSGPEGRVTHADVDRYAAGAPPVRSHLRERTGVTEVKVVGLRRKIAEKMALSKSRIPHITIVEEVDVSELDTLRASLNKGSGGVRLTPLPFIMQAMVRALTEQPDLNATFDDEAGVIRQYAAINIGIATQTAKGLIVPVVRNVEAKSLWDCSLEVDRLANRARDGSATREELSGSTITITSLGPLGAIATTPVINYPEVAIVGVNRIAIRPAWNGTSFIPRQIMNLSSSFDHRVVDGWNAAVFVQRLKELLERPAAIFLDPRP